VDGSTELAGAWPPATPMLKGASQQAEDRETGSRNPLWASPEGGRWQGSRATKGMAATVGVPVRGLLELRERQRKQRGGRCYPGVLPVAFIGWGRELMR
jgi:hypothetical protein